MRPSASWGRDRRRIWPTAQETALLQAALRRDDVGRSAWALVEPGLDFASLDGEPVRLMPLLYRALEVQRVPSPLIGRLKGMYRQAWYHNQLLLPDLRRVLVALNERSIPTVLLKGAALVPFYYGDAGARPMGDIDVLVPAGRAREAIEALTGAGWTPRELVERALRLHSLPMRSAAGHDLDLHWHLADRLRPHGAGEAGAAFIERAVPVEVQGVPTRILAPDDLLFHLCVHGARADGDARLRWPADALMVLRGAGDELDWDRFVETAARWRFVPLMRDALAYLVDALDAPVPDSVLRQLDARPVSMRERLGYRLYARHYGHGPVRSVPIIAGEFLRWSSVRPALTAPLLLPSYLQHRWGLAHRRDIPRLLSFEFRNRGRPPEDLRPAPSRVAR